MTLMSHCLVVLVPVKAKANVAELQCKAARLTLTWTHMAAE